MKALIQRVMNAKVTVNDEIVSSIGQGVCVFIGISSSDNVKDMEHMVLRHIFSTYCNKPNKLSYVPSHLLAGKPEVYRARKILSVRIFDDETDKKWKMSVVDKQLEILCVSQFTLYNTWKGNKPDFHYAMPGDKSREFYDNFLDLLKKEYSPEKIKDGRFGAYMQVSLQNDGPVTFEIQSPSKTSSKESTTRVGDAKDPPSNINYGEEETKV